MGEVVSGVGDVLGLGEAKKLKSSGAFAMTNAAQAAEEAALKRINEQMAGTAPSISEMAYKQALDQMLAQQQAAAASARGVSNPALMQRNISQAAQQTGMEATQQLGMQRLQEQQNAQQQALQAAAAQRGVALQGSTADQAAQEREQQRKSSFFGQLAGSAGSLAALSDENKKENVKKESGKASDAIEQFMNALGSYTYEYENKKDGKGKKMGVMAQDLEKSDLGKQMVEDTEDGKMVDFAMGMAPMFAAIAELNKRTKKLEGK